MLREIANQILQCRPTLLVLDDQPNLRPRFFKAHLLRGLGIRQFNDGKQVLQLHPLHANARIVVAGVGDPGPPQNIRASF